MAMNDTGESLRSNILKDMSGVPETIDPLAGSYYVEALTNKIEKEAYDYIDKIDRMGGAVAAIEQGYMQQEMAAQAQGNQAPRPSDAGNRLAAETDNMHRTTAAGG